jgi:hypothetical protein
MSLKSLPPDASPLFRFAAAMAEAHVANDRLRRITHWCGHPLMDAIEVDRGTCAGCHTREALELDAERRHARDEAYRSGDR